MVRRCLLISIALLFFSSFVCGQQGSVQVMNIATKLDSLESEMIRYTAETEGKMKLLDSQDSMLEEASIILAQRKAQVDSLDNDIQQKSAFIDSQGNFLGAFIAISAVALFSVILVITSLIAKRKANKQLEKSNIVIKNNVNELRLKNQEITDSITYAQRIQNARLPERSAVLKVLPDSFVLFKPKDIVSGDFYFFHQKSDDTVFIAAVDCTGHGVPGAFMSIIGSEKLTDAVEQSSDVSVILKLLNKGIRASLKQSDKDTSTRDGMDIALCKVDLTSKRITYAGANRPIWIIRKEKNELEEIKPTKKAIGGLTENDQEFQKHELELSAGDSFFICTDGYADQFGENNKKLTSKKFKEILLELRNRSMKEHETYLERFFDKWKAKSEQIDDVLLIGVRMH
ncbi:MAG: PP2C family protein-serine/threonine phosphatase [Bacteroidia bacterium]